MMEDIQIIHSPLEQRVEADGRFVHIQIYRGEDSGWILEVVDDLNNSTVWDDEFSTDQEALNCALNEIESEGIEAFIDAPPLAHDQMMDFDPDQLFQPLSDEELEVLERFFMDEAPEDAMTFDRVDGFLHAVAVGPLTLMPSQWLPKIWGSDNGIMPELEDFDRVQEILGLLMRHYNAIIRGFQLSPPLIQPFWYIREYEGQEVEDAEGWAGGFVDGVNLSAEAWKPLLETEEGQRLYRPIRLLGEMELEPEDFALSSTPHQRHALAVQIPQAVLAIYAHWLPVRHANYEREVAKRLAPKVGRNDACPCGSGKKFKKCCGSPAVLH